MRRHTQPYKAARLRFRPRLARLGPLWLKVMRLELVQPDDDDEEQHPQHRYGGRTYRQRQRFRPRTRERMAEWDRRDREALFSARHLRYGEWYPPLPPRPLWQRWLWRLGDLLQDLSYWEPSRPRITIPPYKAPEQ